MTAFSKLDVAAARKPVEVPARIAALPNLPIFYLLEGRKAVVAGGSEGAIWKAELLAAAGADVLLLAGEESAPAPVLAGVEVLARSWREEDLSGAALAIADLQDRAEALRFVAAARDAGVPVNIIDQPAYCDFQFGTIVNRAPIVVAISTAGGAPMLGQSIRARIESVLPLGLSAWAKAALEWRPKAKERLARFADRRLFWQRFTDQAWSAGREPQRADFETLIEGSEGKGGTGSVALVGAGPGDPELLTLKAVNALQRATTILYDDLVGPDILELARREARRIAVGKTGHGPHCSQSEINALIVTLAQAGETVVRLKGGDPLVFGRATEEIEACRAAGIEVSIVPGISAAQGAAAALGFSLTGRRTARRVQFVTGHGADGGLPSDVDWTAIADPQATTVVYMPRKTLREFVGNALAAGLDPATPALAVASATRPDQTQVSAPLHAIADAAAALAAGAPVVVIIGRAAEATTDPASIFSLPKALAS
jgi:uroporphyrin-III C-methyltransferase/precorrin-2 dehydrogenase/sirohydrochlorin ferrochelatase